MTGLSRVVTLLDKPYAYAGLCLAGQDETSCIQCKEVHHIFSGHLLRSPICTCSRAEHSDIADRLGVISAAEKQAISTTLFNQKSDRTAVSVNSSVESLVLDSLLITPSPTKYWAMTAFFSS